MALLLLVLGAEEATVAGRGGSFGLAVDEEDEDDDDSIDDFIFTFRHSVVHDC